jgi:hypothetical protein
MAIMDRATPLAHPDHQIPCRTEQPPVSLFLAPTFIHLVN